MTLEYWYNDKDEKI